MVITEWRFGYCCVWAHTHRQQVSRRRIELTELPETMLRLCQVKQDSQTALLRIKHRFCPLVEMRRSRCTTEAHFLQLQAPVQICIHPVPSGKANKHTDLSALILRFWCLKACGSHWKQGLFCHTAECCCHKQSHILPSQSEMLTICHALKPIGLCRSPCGIIRLLKFHMQVSVLV